MQFRWTFFLSAALVVIPSAVRADERTIATRLEDAEETYELRLERLLIAKGHRALVQHLERELAERPRPYVKAWYANYLLYGVEFGLKEFSDPARGFKLAEESAAEGSPFGLELVGRAWGDGRGTGKRVSTLAIEKLRAAAERGRYTAWSELGKFYFFGDGVAQDRVHGEQLIRRGAWLGATGPLETLAQWWENPAYVGKADRAKANALYYEAGDLGSARARGILRERAEQGDQDAQKYVHLDFIVEARQGSDPLPAKLRAAVKWLEKHAAPDDFPVQLALAELMLERTLVVYDVDAARAKLERAIAAGSAQARFIESTRAWRGIGRKKDEAAAVSVWRELAEQGNPAAMNQIGWLHWWGNGEKHGVEKSAEKAFEYCRRAAIAGHWAGQLNLAECYAHGIGVPVNYFLAGKYYGILADRRFKNAREMKARVLGYVKD